VLVADYAAVTPEAFSALRELAAALEAPVIDCGARLNFPTGDRLNFTNLSSVLDEADLVVGFEIEDRYGQAVDRLAGKELVHVSLGHMRVRSWAEDALRLLPATQTLSAASEAVLPALARAVAERPPSAETLTARRSALDGRVAAARHAWESEARNADQIGGRIPVSRVAWEIWETIRSKRYALVGGSLGDWERRLWSFDAERPHLGGQAGGGLGFVAGSAVGATLALGRSHLCLAVVPDGDLLYAPGALWTAARAGLPLLMVTNNNRAYQNTLNHASRLAAARGRAPEASRRENVIDEPPADLAGLARSLGVWATGPVADPSELRPALESALEIVTAGKPALVDVLTAGE
jgi:thiamine pyrophosphate-dependent acetolactate synthase large subunit-like protein